MEEVWSYKAKVEGVESGGHPLWRLVLVDVNVRICSRSNQSSKGINYTHTELCFKMGRVEGV